MNIHLGDWQFQLKTVNRYHRLAMAPVPACGGSDYHSLAGPDGGPVVHQIHRHHWPITALGGCAVQGAAYG